MTDPASTTRPALEAWAKDMAGTTVTAATPALALCAAALKARLV